MRALRLIPVAIAAAVICPAPAVAQETPKPQPRCGLLVADSTGDTTSQVPTQARPKPPALDITRVFLDHEPGRAGATTVNIEVVDLSIERPIGTTGLVWTAEWRSPTGLIRFVRAVVDYTGTTIYEFGEVIPGTDVPGVITNVLPRYEPRGRTIGQIFPGPLGVVQIAIPDTWDGALGTQLTEMYAGTSEARQLVPNAVNTPSRGLSNPADRAPNAGTTAKWTVADSACPPAPTA